MVSRELEYIGDGVYARFDGYQVWIWTSNGISDGQPIALEPEVLEALFKYNKEVRATYTTEGNTDDNRFRRKP